MTRHIRVLIIGAALILVGNAVALIGVAYNRSGEPDAVLQLSERELTRPYNYMASTDNSGLALHLNWRSVGGSRPYPPGNLNQGGTTRWFDKDKLAELGFDIDADPQDPDSLRSYRKTLPRKAYVVLEFNGPAYQAALQQRQAELQEVHGLLANNPGNKEFERRLKFAQKHLDGEAHRSSRLFAVDVGLDPETLRARYPDHARYLILPGQVRLSIFNKTLTGYITGLNVSTVNVPLAYRAAITGGEGAKPDHYTVRLAFGKRAEPWILTAQAGEEGMKNMNDRAAN